MTKKLLIAAASASALLLAAGSASAGKYLNGSVGGVNIGPDSSVAATWTPYRVAAEAAGTLTTDTAAAADNLIVTVDLTNDLVIPAAQNATYTVVFSLEGAGATFAGAPAVAAVDGTLAAAPADTTIATHINAQGQLVAVVTVNAPAANVTIGGFTLTTDISSTERGNVTLRTQTRVAAAGAGGEDLILDNTSAQVIASAALINRLEAVLSPTTAVGTFGATAGTQVAKLLDYKTFIDAFNPPSNSATSASLLSNIKLGTSVAGAAPFHADLRGTPVVAADIVNGGTVTVRSLTSGGNVNALVRGFAGNTTQVGASDTQVSFNLTQAQASAATGPAGATGSNLLLNNAGAAAVVLNEADYTVSFLPTYIGGFTAPATAYTAQVVGQGTAIGKVIQEGVHFIAPWTNISANAIGASTLRIANNGANPTGPVFVRLLSQRNGASGVIGTRAQIAQGDLVAGVLTANGGIPAGEFITIRASALADRLGDTNNADLRVTVQGEAGTLTAKLRVASQGQTFETGLNNVF